MFNGFDMVFLDGDKREYPAYYRMLMGEPHETGEMGKMGERGKVGEAGETGNEQGALPMVHSGTTILADNVLWYGKVAEPEAIKAADRMSAGIMEFNRLVAQDPRVENVILPLRDGINVIRVK
jgi:caffeoyl-CoA O-methyltransferase